MKVKLTMIVENDKPAGEHTNEELKGSYQTAFDLLIMIGAMAEPASYHGDKVNVLAAEILEEEGMDHAEEV